MRIHRLEISGIGPFGATHLIDFTKLTSSGIFLLEGPTGSGKSTIIDSIVFGLYGKVAGSNNTTTDDRMRSTHAPDNRPSHVDLVFEVSSGIYRVLRTPAWEKPKARGAGTTNVSQTANLWRLSQEAVDAGKWNTGEPLASGARDVGIELQPILGLSREQFVQTVVLPQGEFAKFLRLKSDDRSKLLESLFDTRSYSEFAQKLAEDSKNASHAVNAARAKFDSALDALLSIEALSERIEPIRELHSSVIDSSDTAILDELETIRSEIQDRSVILHNRSVEAQQADAEAGAALRAAEHLTKALEERAQLLRSKSKLEDHTQEINSMRERVNQHTRTEAAFSRLRDVEKDRVEVMAAATDALNLLEEFDFSSHHGLSQDATQPVRDSLKSPLSMTGALQKYCEELSRSLSSVEENLGEQLGTLKALAQSEARLEQLTKQKENLTSDLDDLTSQITKHVAARNKIPAEKEDLEKQLSEAIARVDSGTSAREKITGVENLLTISDSLDQTNSEVTALNASLASALNELSKKRTAVDEVTNDWVKSAAAELAAELSENEACPVCGSVSHPTPASPSNRLATKDDVDAAQMVLDSAKAIVDRTQGELSQKRGRADLLSSQLGENTAESLAQQHQTLRVAITTADAASQDVKRLENAIEALASRHEKLSTGLADFATRKAENSARIEALSTEMSTIAASIASVVEDGQTIASLQASHESARKSTQRLRESLEHAGHKARSLNGSQSAFDTALSSSGHTSVESLEAAMLDNQTLQELKEEIAHFESAMARIDGRLEAPDIVNLTGAEDPRLDALSKAKDDASLALAHATKEASLAEQAAKDTTRLLGAVQDRHQEWSRIDQESGAIVRLSNLANAQSQSLTKIPLNIWVLLQRFEIVVERANEHLLTFSLGRYELVRTDEGTHERKTGLGLEVVDHNGHPDGDIRRSSLSLSGGETFYASLSLALALAEVVQEESGGVRIETLLIDEGFGTLSQDVREIVMQTLATLTDSGRAVGIVSHVEELKNMVPNRIEVRPDANGGSTLNVIS